VIVKLDDAGLYLMHRDGAVLQALGRILLGTAPRLMKLLAFIGTLAMFMVGGGILVHGLPAIHENIHHVVEAAGGLPVAGSAVAFALPLLLEVLVGVIAGALVLVVVKLVARLRGKVETEHRA
jgi:predicted DNA repair protein MutK